MRSPTSGSTTLIMPPLRWPLISSVRNTSRRLVLEIERARKHLRHALQGLEVGAQQGGTGSNRSWS
ncbi:MAG: hypothetical protein V5B36_06755 [Candidatus Accumulibacter sp. UW25]